jgi:hypothetical protein
MLPNQRPATESPSLHPHAISGVKHPSPTQEACLYFSNDNKASVCVCEWSGGSGVPAPLPPAHSSATADTSASPFPPLSGARRQGNAETASARTEPVRSAWAGYPQQIRWTASFCSAAGMHWSGPNDSSDSVGLGDQSGQTSSSILCTA